MKRKITEEFIKWKNEDKGRTALLVEGARRVGKSYIVEEFARKYYKSYILIDFMIASPQVKQLFEDYLDDLDSFFARLSLFTHRELFERDTLIIFDKIQMYPKARAALKYLVADGRYDYIETGSLLSIRKNTSQIVIPSEEKHIKLNPMDFEEYLWARNDNVTMKLIRTCFEEKKPIGQAAHREIMKRFREYILIGGMPQVVKTFIETNDFMKAEEAKKMILDLYRDDISKYAEGYKEKVRAIFDEIPYSLARHDISFKLAAIDKNARMRDYESAFFWLKDAMICNMCYMSTEPNIGLGINAERLRLKPYFSDTGLLISMIFDENGLADKEIYEKILTDKLEVNLGLVMENAVAQMITASGRKLYYYASNDAEDKNNRMEIDFLIRKRGVTSRHNIIPVEVKSSSHYKTISLNKFIKKFQNYSGAPIIIHTGDYMVKNGIECFPVYMTELL